MRYLALGMVWLGLALASACNVPLDSFHSADAMADTTPDASVEPGVCVQPPSGIVAWWPGDNNDPVVAANISGGHHDGSLAGGVAYVDGKVSRAFSFNGSGAFAEIPTLAIRSAISVEFWVYPLPHAVSGIITTVDNALGSGLEGSGWHIGYYGNNLPQSYLTQHIVFTINESSVSGTSVFSAEGSVPFGKWTHVAATSDGHVMRLYIDGSEVALLPSPSILPSAFSTLLGAYQRNGVKEQFFQGWVDETTVYNRALSVEEVRAIFSAGSAGKCRP